MRRNTPVTKTILAPVVLDSCKQIVTVSALISLLPQFQCNGFSEDPNDPIFNPATTVAYYQTVRFDLAEFAPFSPTPSFYKMWYDYASAGGVALADSLDGIHWTPGIPTTGLVPRARHARVLFDRDGFGANPPYPFRVWYWDSTSEYQTTPGAILDPLRTASSPDGVTWVDDQNMLQDLGAPLLSTTPGFEHASYGPHDVLFFPENPPIIDVDHPFNNRFVMYYDISTGGPEQLAMAASTDGVLWYRVGTPVVLPYGGPSTWDANYATFAGVVLQFGPDQFHMLYSGGIFRTSEGIGCASSSDGIHWTKYAGNPIFSITDGVAWRSARTYNPWVLYDANKFSGHGDAVPYKLWFSGAPASNPSDYAIGYGTQS